MKALLLTGLLFILILSGCRKESATLPLLQSVEGLIPMYADSASALLDSIKAPDELGNKVCCVVKRRTKQPPDYSPSTNGNGHKNGL